MYRTAAKRLLLRAPSGSISNSKARLCFPSLQNIITNTNSSRLRFSTYENQSINPNPNPNPNQHPETPIYSDTTSSSSTRSASSTAEEFRRQQSRRPKVEYQDEQARVLQASLPHVVNELPFFNLMNAHNVYDKMSSRTHCLCLLRHNASFVMLLMVILQVRLGWTEAAMIAGAKAVGVSPSIIGSFPRKEAALVEVPFVSLS
jgi:ubiquinone biosynthesis protein COQ9